MRTKLFLLSVDVEQEIKRNNAIYINEYFFNLFMNSLNWLITCKKTDAKIFNFDLCTKIYYCQLIKKFNRYSKVKEEREELYLSNISYGIR